MGFERALRTDRTHCFTNPHHVLLTFLIVMQTLLLLLHETGIRAEGRLGDRETGSTGSVEEMGLQYRMSEAPNTPRVQMKLRMIVSMSVCVHLHG